MGMKPFRSGVNLTTFDDPAGCVAARRRAEELGFGMPLGARPPRRAGARCSRSAVASGSRERRDVNAVLIAVSVQLLSNNVQRNGASIPPRLTAGAQAPGEEPRPRSFIASGPSRVVRHRRIGG
jgi:hypothetical protein